MPTLFFKKIFFGIFAVLGIIFSLCYLTHTEKRLPDIFGLDRIALDLSEIPLTNHLPETEIQTLSLLANQPFSYLGYGGQMVAFSSADEKYVLKFFLKKSLRGAKTFRMPKPTHWISSHRSKSQEKRKQRALKSILRAMHSYHLAFEKIPAYTGLLLLHFSSGKDSLPTVQVLDQYGHPFTIDLNRSSFVFQKKAVPVQQKLALLATEEERTRALCLLERFFEEKIQKGLIDREPEFMIGENYGFIGDTPVQFDVGSVEYRMDIQANPEKEIVKTKQLISNWYSCQKSLSSALMESGTR